MREMEVDSVQNGFLSKHTDIAHTHTQKHTHTNLFNRLIEFIKVKNS